MWKYNCSRPCTYVQKGDIVFSNYHFKDLKVLEIAYHKDDYCSYLAAPRPKLEGSGMPYTHISWLVNCETCTYYRKEGLE